MVDFSHATQITMLFREFNKNDYSLCLSYFQIMDPADLTYENMIVSVLVLSNKPIQMSHFHSSILIFYLLAMLRFDPDFCSSRTGNPMSRSLVADSNLLQNR
ncbi:unnamed protein product [Hymenolepis diminuta]|uniref:Uncharacterized protein n=1 Tax=Hymenolepis diminuta TaxID=6216 RepID=A0A564Y7U6_HYMDI|nr:unnamed protein product [Hymenolepis diminuta]